MGGNQWFYCPWTYETLSSHLSVYIITCIFHLFGESKEFCRFEQFDCSPWFLTLMHPRVGKLTLLIIPTGQTLGNIPQEGNMSIMPQWHSGIRRGTFMHLHIISWGCVASIAHFPGRSYECGCTFSIWQPLDLKKKRKKRMSMWFSQWISCYMQASISNQVLHADVFFYLQKEAITVLTAKQESVEDNHVGLVALI